jgi:hypothetical protein
MHMCQIDADNITSSYIGSVFHIEHVRRDCIIAVQHESRVSAAALTGLFCDCAHLMPWCRLTSMRNTAYATRLVPVCLAMYIWARIVRQARKSPSSSGHSVLQTVWHQRHPSCHSTRSAWHKPREDLQNMPTAVFPQDYSASRRSAHLSHRADARQTDHLS